MLQLDSAQSIAQLADAAAISPSACHRRMRALEEKGIIAGYGARLDPAKLGLAMIVFVEIALTSQSRESMEAFEKAVLGFDDILDCHLMSGSADYLLRIAASDPGQYDSIHRNCLSRLPGVASMRSSFSIRNIKPWRGFPITKGN
jgi:DNA-binding Lrp family transcriptional regulator